VVLRKLRSDYQAIALLVLSVIANTVLTNADKFLGGAAGISLVPAPVGDLITPRTEPYEYFYIGITAVCVLLAFFVVNRVVNSPYGRSLRAMREREIAATAIGKNPVQLKMAVFILGGMIAGLSGAILVGFINVWAPSVWLYPETIILFAAIIVGGRGNNIGAILGALLVPVGFEEVTRLINSNGTLANFGPPGLLSALQWVAIGLLILGFLWFRPQGVRPEPRRIFEGGPD
jgi:branched-chain amino acid transport system permease protein